MTGEDGCAFYERVRLEGGGSIPAVAQTTHARPTDLARTRRAGFALHLRKPAGLVEIAGVVAALARADAAPPPPPREIAT